MVVVVVSPAFFHSFSSHLCLQLSLQVGKVTRDLYDTLVGIQTERVPDNYGWLYDPFADKQ